MLRKKISNLARPPQTLAQLRCEIQVAWDSVPQEDIDHEIAEFEFKPTANKSQDSTGVGTTSDH
jgi:hypothetical protein